MKKKKIIIGVIILFCIVVGVMKYRSTTTLPLPSAIWVKATPVKESTLPLEVGAIGTLTSQNVEITPEVAGHVKAINFNDGQDVKAYDALIQLDDSIYKTKYKLAESKLNYSQTNLTRMQTLSKRGIVTKQALEQAEADFKEKKAGVEESKVMLKKMNLLAPFEGVIGQRRVHPGNYVNVGQSLVTLTDTKRLHIEYNLPEKYLPLLKLGQTVTITTTAYPDKTFFAKVSFISPTINSATRAISLYADVENKNNLLATGMFVNVKQVLAGEERVYTIPARSLMPIIEGEQVYKVVNGKALAAIVVIGRRLGNDVQILQGLKPDDLVVTDGQMKIRSGMAVNLSKD